MSAARTAAPTAWSILRAGPTNQLAARPTVKPRLFQFTRDLSAIQLPPQPLDGIRRPAGPEMEGST
jgi:hypothetical protein